MTLSIAHAEGSRVILDLVREVKAPFSPDAVTEQFCEIIKSYGLTLCFGDNYAKLWPVERFAQHGVSYNRAVLSKSDICLNFLPIINSHRVQLLALPAVRTVVRPATLHRAWWPRHGRSHSRPQLP